MNECIAYLYFGGQRYYRKATTVFVIRLHYAFRGSKVRVRGVAQVYLASEQAAGRRKGYAMYGYVLAWVVVSSRRVFSLVRGMFARYASKVQYSVLRQT